MNATIFQQLQQVFLQKFPEPNPKLEVSISEKIQKFVFNLDDEKFKEYFTIDDKETLTNNDRNQSKNVNKNENKIITAFSLDINDRVDLLTFLSIKSNEITISPTNKLFYSILLLQSFSSLFFVNINKLLNDDSDNKLTTKEIYLFINSLSQSIQLNSSLFEISYRSYSIFYSKFTQLDLINDQLLDILNYTNEFLLSTKKIPYFFYPILSQVSMKLLHFSENISTQEEKAKNMKFIEHFEKVSTKLEEQESITDPKTVFTEFDLSNFSEFFSTAANFSSFFNFNDLSESVVKFCLDFSFCTGIQFIQIIPLFEGIIQQTEFNSKERIETDFKHIYDFASDSISLLEKETFSNRFEPIFKIFRQISNKKKLVSIVFSMTMENIFNGNLDDLLFLLLFIQHNFVDDQIMIQFLKKQLNLPNHQKTDLFSIFIPERIYQNTIFDDNKKSYLLLLKSVGLKLYQKFAKVDLKLYNSLFELFDNLKNFEKSFTELLIVSFSILSDNYLTNDGFFRTFRAAFANLKNIECISLIIDFLNEIFNSETFLFSAIDSLEANLFFVQLLNQSSYEKVGQSFFRKLFAFLSETSEKAPSFEYLQEAVSETIEKSHFFRLFYEIVDSMENSVLKNVLKTTLFKLIQETIVSCNENVVDDDECFDSMFRLLELYYSDSVPKFKIDWELITRRYIEKRKGRLSQSIYKSILSILSYIKAFEGFKEPVPLVKIIFCSEKYSKNFLEKLYSAIINNSVRILAFYQAGIIKILLDFTIDLISKQESHKNIEINSKLISEQELHESNVNDSKLISEQELFKNDDDSNSISEEESHESDSDDLSNSLRDNIKLTDSKSSNVRLIKFNSNDLFSSTSKLEILNDHHEDDLFDLIMKVVVLVDRFICDRETSEKFLSIFNHLDLSHKINHIRISKFLKYLEDSLNENQLSPSSALRFDSLSSSILLPSLPINFFNLGFTIFVSLLVPHFKSMMSLASFISQNSFLCIYLAQHKIVISSNHYSKPIVIPVDFPKNEWFDLKIHFKSLGEVIIQLNDDNLIFDSSQSSCDPFHLSPIETAIMLKPTVSTSKFKNVEGILTKIMIYIGPLKRSFLNGDINDPSLFALFTPRFIDSENHLKNLAYNYIPPNLISQQENSIESNFDSILNDDNKDAVYCANCESYIPTFANVFTSFSGLNDFILFFSREGLDIEIISNLFSTLKFLLKKSNELQKQMLEINGFYLITYFIRNIKPSDLSVEFWENIIEFEKIITNIDLMKNFFDSLILSFKPYLESDESVLFRVMTKWSRIEPTFFISCVTFPLFCQMIYHQFHDRKVTSNIQTLLIQIIVNVSRLFGQKEMLLLCQMIGKMSVDDIESSLTMFQAVRAITTSYPKLHDIAINIMINDDRLMHSNHPEILCAVLQLFAQRNLKYLALLLKTQISIQRDYFEINRFLSHFCGVFVGKSFKSLENINEIELSDHTIYLPILPFILSFAFQSSSNQIEKITNFLIRIFNDSLCLHYVASSINPVTLFLLISYAIVLSNRLVKYLIDIISLNINLFADAYQIIDILAEELNSNFHDYQNAIASSVILKVIELNNSKSKNNFIDVPKMIDIVVNSICFGINRSVFEFTKYASVFLPKEVVRRNSSYIKPSFLKKADNNNVSLPNISLYVGSSTDASSTASKESFTKISSDSENSNKVNLSNSPVDSQENSKESFPKLSVDNQENLLQSRDKESLPKFSASSDQGNSKENLSNSSFSNQIANKESLPKFSASSDQLNNKEDLSESSVGNQIANKESLNKLSVNSIQVSPFSGFHHSVSFDLLQSPARDRRSSLVDQQPPELLYSLSFFIRKKFVLKQIFDKLKENTLKKKVNKFGLLYKNKEVWADMKTTELLMTFLNDFSLPEETSIQLCVMLSFLCHNQLFQSKKINYMLNLVAERYEIGTPFIYPLLNEVSLHISDFKEARFFLLKYESILASPSVKLYEEASNFMNHFITSLHPISSVGDKLSQLFSFEMEEFQFVDIDSYFLDLKQKELTKNNLRERMFRKLRPIWTNSMRRFNIIDNHFRPFLLTNSQQLNYQILDSPSVQDHFTTNEIWSAKCERVKLYTKIPGIFIITKDGIRFSTTKGKPLFILKNSVHCIFWNYYHHLPNSFTFTTLRGKTFLFRFMTQITNDDDEEENDDKKIYLNEGETTVVYKITATRNDVVSNLKKINLNNCVFFQDSDPSCEIERLCLTQQWRKREISNFDYILWLNLLSGRSFLDIESYPIFPLLFTSTDDQSLVRDLSKNVSLALSVGNMEKWRERKYSDLDPYKSFLFNKTSSTPELTKRFLFEIEQFRIGENKVKNVVNRCENVDNNKNDDKLNSKRSTNDENKIENHQNKKVIENKNENSMKSEKSNKNSGSSDCENCSSNNDKRESVFKPFSSYSEILGEITEGRLQCELPPEFFFMPEIFTKWTDFPKWAPNASSFVMKNLEALESEEVSLSIHKWIDMIWGVNQNHESLIDPDLSPTVWHFSGMQQNEKDAKNRNSPKEKKKKKWLKNFLNETKPNINRKSDVDIERNKRIHWKLSNNGQIPVRLFVGPHPARGTCNKSQTKHTSFNLISEGFVRTIGVTVTDGKLKEVEIFLFHDNEVISKVLCHANKFNKGMKIPFEFHHFEHVLFCGSFLCFVILGTKNLFGFDFNEKTFYLGDESPHLKGINCIDSSSSSIYFASGSADSSIVTWKISEKNETKKNLNSSSSLKLNGAINPFTDKFSDSILNVNSILNTKKIVPFRTLIAHRKPIIHVKIQDEMRILLAIDESGILSISVFPYLKLIKTIDTGILRSDDIIMTRNSFVIFRGKEAVNFTANGVKNGSRKFSFNIICAESIESRMRTDVIALSTSQNEIVTINSVSLKAISILEHQPSKIVVMKYNQEIDGLICYTESKKVLVVPIAD
ncbi:hypothetical protein M9Y10_039657 [Tritrichomonas musculus]|uniref:BEACH domain-containing protein n=1 Tax=Tritrichomonas musculus TaxID=1915356 RepID=A0ABR2GMW3_9EUKA